MGQAAMTRRRARIMEAEVNRVVSAAKKAGATEIEVKLDSNGPWVKIVLSGGKPVADDEIVI